MHLIFFIRLHWSNFNCARFARFHIRSATLHPISVTTEWWERGTFGCVCLRAPWWTGCCELKNWIQCHYVITKKSQRAVKSVGHRILSLRRKCMQYTYAFTNTKHNIDIKERVIVIVFCISISLALTSTTSLHPIILYSFLVWKPNQHSIVTGTQHKE